MILIVRRCTALSPTGGVRNEQRAKVGVIAYITCELLLSKLCLRETPSYIVA